MTTTKDKIIEISKENPIVYYAVGLHLARSVSWVEAMELAVIVLAKELKESQRWKKN